jgi:hypothetical protein
VIELAEIQEADVGAPVVGAATVQGNEPYGPLPLPCPSCGAREMKEFCARCGERRLVADDHSLRRFAGEAFEAVTNLDSRVWRSFAALVLRPGQLSREHFRGVRQPYLGPLRIFLLCNLVFFLLQAVAPLPIFNVQLEYVLHHLGGVLRSVPAPDGTTFGEFAQRPDEFAPYAEEFGRVAGNLTRSLVIVMVPLFAALSFAVFGRRRRFYANHLVFALHIYAFVLVLFSAITLVLHGAGWLVATVGPDAMRTVFQRSLDPLLSVMIFGSTLMYFAVASRRAFDASWPAAAGGALVFAVGWFMILVIYRVILFFATLAVL